MALLRVFLVIQLVLRCVTSHVNMESDLNISNSNSKKQGFSIGAEQRERKRAINAKYYAKKKAALSNAVPGTVSDENLGAVQSVGPSNLNSNVVEGENACTKC
jgi:hypothetical protein